MGKAFVVSDRLCKIQKKTYLLSLTTFKITVRNFNNCHKHIASPFHPTVYLPFVVMVRSL